MNRRELLGGAAALPFAPGSAPAQVAENLPAPDLGDLHPLMDWLSSQNRPRLSFLEREWKSLPSWKKAARGLFLRELSYQPKPEPLGADLVAREERAGFRVETVRITATPAYRIPARVLIPEGGKGRLPGVVALHCHSGRYVWGHEKVLSRAGEHPALREFRDRVYGRPFAEALARRGFVVLVIDAFYFGERRLRPEMLEAASAPGETRNQLRALAGLAADTPEWFQAVNSLCGSYEHLTAKTIFAAGATWPGILAWDDARSLDYLASRPEVDPKRLGCVGLSIGGLRAVYLMAADPRLKVACVAGWMTAFRHQLRNHLRSHTWMAYLPGLYPWLDLPDAAALLAPGALLVQQCGRDALYPVSGMKEAVEKLKKIYTKAEARERFRGAFYDLPHSFRPEMQEEAFAWLEKWI